MVQRATTQILVSEAESPLLVPIGPLQVRQISIRLHGSYKSILMMQRQLLPSQLSETLICMHSGLLFNTPLHITEI